MSDRRGFLRGSLAAFLAAFLPGKPALASGGVVDEPIEAILARIDAKARRFEPADYLETVDAIAHGEVFDFGGITWRRGRA